MFEKFMNAIAITISALIIIIFTLSRFTMETTEKYGSRGTGFRELIHLFKIKGIVRSKESGVPLKDVNINIVGRNYAVTGNNGTFELQFGYRRDGFTAVILEASTPSADKPEKTVEVRLDRPVVDSIEILL